MAPPPNSGTLVALSDELSAAVAAVAPSVAYVDAHPRRDASGVAWDEHHLVTVDHILDREDDITVRLADGVTATASVVGRDPSTDLAMLHTSTTLRPLRREPNVALAVGQLALAIGRDEDGAPGASFGVISVLDDAWRTWRGGTIDRFVRPDLNVYPSFSGGPLVNARGDLIGLNTWGLSRRMALTIPIETLERVVVQLLGHGRIARPYLGIAMQGVRLPESLRERHGLAQRGAAIAIDVASEGPAERAGLAIGDLIVAVADHVVEDSEDLQRALASVSVGSVATLRILRAGETHELTATIGERPHNDD